MRFARLWPSLMLACSLSFAVAPATSVSAPWQDLPRIDVEAASSPFDARRVQCRAATRFFIGPVFSLCPCSALTGNEVRSNLWPHRLTRSRDHEIDADVPP